MNVFLEATDAQTLGGLKALTVFTWTRPATQGLVLLRTAKGYVYLATGSGSPDYPTGSHFTLGEPGTFDASTPVRVRGKLTTAGD